MLMVGSFFCRFCEHSVDFTHMDTVKDHLKSKKHCSRPKRRGSSSRVELHPRQQVILSAVLKSKNLREGFVSDYLKVYTVADIHL